MGNVVAIHSTYTTGTRALPDIYTHALGPVRMYQTNHMDESVESGYRVSIVQSST